MSIAIYVASRFPDIQQARGVANFLAQYGYNITARWLAEETPSSDDTVTNEQRTYFAQLDVYDVRRAQVLVLVNVAGHEKIGSGGCHVETGMALALGIPVIVLGKLSNVFHWLPDVYQASTVDDIPVLVERLRCVRSRIIDFAHGAPPAEGWGETPALAPKRSG